MAVLKTFTTKSLPDFSSGMGLLFHTTTLSPWKLRCILLLGLCWCAFCITSPSVAQTAQVHEIKALFLYNFANFVFWPSSAFESPSSPIRYCVTSSSKVVDTLTDLIDGEKVGGRPLTLQWVNTRVEMKNCHILFLHEDESERFITVRQIQSKGILTVSDGEDFAAQGGMISLVRDSNRVRLVINRNTVDAARLRISAKLLRLAKLI